MLHLDNISVTQATYEAIFMGFNAGHQWVKYPRVLYKEGEDPLYCENTDDENEARANGYDTFTAGALSNRHIINWFWDFEDMSPRQLVVFAREEYDVDLPIEAGQLKLFQAVCELTRAAPQNRNRLILMAHVVSMNYDETLEQIKRTMKNPDATANIERESFEVML